MKAKPQWRAPALLLTILIGATIASCDRDGPTTLRRAFQTATPANKSVSTLGSYSIRVPPSNSGSEGAGPSGGGVVASTSTGITIPAWTAFVVKVNGRISAAKNSRFVQCYETQGTTYPNDGKSFGPFGTGANNWELKVTATLHNSNNTQSGVDFLNPTYGVAGPDSVVSDTLFTWLAADLWVQRGGLYTYTSGPQCGMEVVGQYLLSGTQTISVQELSDDVLLLTAPNAVHPGTQVTFTPSLAGGGTINATLNWQWTPDSAGTDSTHACGSGANPCSTKVWRSGTMKVVGTIAGRVRQAKAHLLVYTTFSLDADKAQAYVSDTVTFTPQVDGKTAKAARWRWAQATDSTVACSADSLCKKVLLRAGTGTMWAYLSSVPGQGDSASKAVTVSPIIRLQCTPGSVIRGATIQCSAQATGSLVLTAWRFTPQDSSNIGTIVRDDDVANTVWTGPLVVAGTVTAEGTVDGASARPGRASVAAQARPGWTWKPDTSSRIANPGELECNTSPHYVVPITFGWVIGSDCASANVFLSPNPTIGDGGIPFKHLLTGPNKGLWYADTMKTGLHLTAQMLRDLRPDGVGYPVTAGDTVGTGCQAAHLLGPPPDLQDLTVTQVNLECMHNVGTGNYDDLIAFTWLHERCHMRRAQTMFQEVPDVKSTVEGLVRSDSLALRSAVIFDSGLTDAESEISSASAAIDITNATLFSWWARNQINTAWFLRSSQPEGVAYPHPLCQ